MLAYLTLIYTLNTLLSIHMPSSGYDLVLLPGKKNSWGINFTRCWKCSLGILVHAEFIPYAVPVWCYCWIRFHFANLLFHHLGSVQTTDVTVMFLESSEMTRWALISLLLSLLPDCFLRASFPFFFCSDRTASDCKIFVYHFTIKSIHCAVKTISFGNNTSA